jgi:hypothetical protein
LEASSTSFGGFKRCVWRLLCFAFFSSFFFLLSLLFFLYSFKNKEKRKYSNTVNTVRYINFLRAYRVHAVRAIHFSEYYCIYCITVTIVRLSQQFMRFDGKGTYFIRITMLFGNKCRLKDRSRWSTTRKSCLVDK